MEQFRFAFVDTTTPAPAKKDEASTRPVRRPRSGFVQLWFGARELERMPRVGARRREQLEPNSPTNLLFLMRLEIEKAHPEVWFWNPGKHAVLEARALFRRIPRAGRPASVASMRTLIPAFARLERRDVAAAGWPFGEFIARYAPAILRPSGRKCSPLPRARSLNPRKITQRERAELQTASLFDGDLRELYAQRPKTRAECVSGPRPCPWVSCRHHAAIEVNEETLSLKLNFPHISNESDEYDLDLDQLQDTCTLDVADRVAESGEELEWPHVGGVLNLSIERARQHNASGLQEMLVKLRRVTGGQIVPIEALKRALVEMRKGRK